MILVPDKCLVCGAKWRGGHAWPGTALLETQTVYYDCCGSLWYYDIGMNCYRVMVKCPSEIQHPELNASITHDGISHD